MWHPMVRQTCFVVGSMADFRIACCQEKIEFNAHAFIVVGAHAEKRRGQQEREDLLSGLYPKPSQASSRSFTIVVKQYYAPLVNYISNLLSGETMSILITITRVRVNRDGYDSIGAYYGAGQTGHSWEAEHPHGRLQGHITGRDGRKTKWAAVRAAHEAIERYVGIRTLPRRVEFT